MLPAYLIEVGLNAVAACPAPGPRLAGALVARGKAGCPRGGPHGLDQGHERPLVAEQDQPGCLLRALPVVGGTCANA
jgi:hypothetical protein